MKEIHYKCRPLTGNQRHQMENVLIEEMDIQAWYAIIFSPILDTHLILIIQ